jgi:uncharacterized coiled-coil DUF342 family protein
MQSLPRQLSFDDVTTSNIYAAIESLQNDVAEIKRSIAETPELLKDVVEQMHEVLAALDELQKLRLELSAETTYGLIGPPITKRNGGALGGRA